MVAGAGRAIGSSRHQKKVLPFKSFQILSRLAAFTGCRRPQRPSGGVGGVQLVVNPFKGSFEDMSHCLYPFLYADGQARRYGKEMSLLASSKVQRIP